jgi:putative hemolysin
LDVGGGEGCGREEVHPGAEAFEVLLLLWVEEVAAQQLLIAQADLLEGCQGVLAVLLAVLGQLDFVQHYPEQLLGEVHVVLARVYHHTEQTSEDLRVVGFHEAEVECFCVLHHIF